MSFVEIRERETVDEALRRLRKMNEREGISREIKKRRFYEKPSEERKRKKEARIRKLLKKMRRNRFRRDW